MNIQSYDIIVAGGGGAAIKSAIAAYEENQHLKIAVITKGEFGMSGVTANACSDRMAFHATLSYTEPAGDESWKYHADDIYRIGGCVSDYNLAEILARNSADAFESLDSLGVPFAKKNGRAVQFLTDGSKYARACFTGPYTAVHIEKALVERIKTLPVDIIEHTMITDAIVENSRIKGVYALGDDGAERVFGCKALILGTGGAGEVYKHHVFTKDSTGDGYAIALRAGASLVNMEFIQIGPSSVKTKLACSGSLMRAIPRFINENGEEFLPNTLPSGMTPEKICEVIFMKGSSWPLSNEDESNVLDVAVFRQIMKGHQVFLDYSGNTQGFDFSRLSIKCRTFYEKESVFLQTLEERQKSPLNRLKEINPMSIKWLKDNGIDLEKGECIEIIPSIQHYQGGVKIGEDASTSIKGLYAAGECAGGQHGANRPGGNALLDCQVFGKIAGESSVKYVSMNSGGAETCSTEENENYFKNIYHTSGKEIPAAAARKEIQSLMSRYGSVIRTEEGIKTAQKRMIEIKEKGISIDPKGLYYYIETLNIMDTAIAALEAMSMRCESRGPHLFFKSENDVRQMPRNDENFSSYFVISTDENGISIQKCQPVRP